MLFTCNGATAFWASQMLGRFSYFTQNVLQLGVFLTGILMFMRLFDAITDPIIASWFDNYESKYGKYRFFMIIGAILTIFPMLAIFLYPVNPTNIPIGVTYFILILMFMITVIGYTILMTVNFAGQAIITQAPEQRPITGLGSAFFNNIGLGFILLMITSDLFGKMQDPYVWRVTSITLATISIIMTILALWAISSRDNTRYYSYKKRRESIKIREFLKVIKRNNAMKRFIIATASDAFSLGARGTFAVYLFANIIMQRSLIFPVEIISAFVLGFPILLIGLYIASKKGTAEVYTKVALIQTIVALTGFISVLILLPADPYRVFSGFTFGVILVCFLFGLFESIWGLVGSLRFPLIGDLIDYEYTLSGKFLPGTISAITTFIDKAIGSLIFLVITGIMVFSGFSGVGESAVVPENVFINNRFYYGILMATFLLPAIGHLITYIAMRSYPLTRELSNKISLDMSEERKRKLL